MQTENISFILERLHYLGFGDKLGIPERLIAALKDDPAEITLDADLFIEDTCRMEVKLYFQRSAQHMSYYFIKYMAKIFYIEDAAANRAHMFYIYKGRGVTLKEAYNLLQGRAVNREMYEDDGTPYNAWIQLNFDVMTPSGNYRIQKWRESYGFDLEKTLEKYPIRELLVENLKQVLLKSLKRGNLHPVTMVKGTRIEQWLLEAVPKYKSVKLYPATEGTVYNPEGADHTAMTGSMANIGEPAMPWEPESETEDDEEVEESQALPGDEITEEDEDDEKKVVERVGIAGGGKTTRAGDGKRTRKPIKQRRFR